MPRRFSTVGCELLNPLKNLTLIGWAVSVPCKTRPPHLWKKSLFRRSGNRDFFSCFIWSFSVLFYTLMAFRREMEYSHFSFTGIPVKSPRASAYHCSWGR